MNDISEAPATLQSPSRFFNRELSWLDFNMRVLEEAKTRKVICEGVPTPVSVTCSVGLVCTKGKVVLSVERFMDMADKALYEAKAQGKDSTSPSRTRS